MGASCCITGTTEKETLKKSLEWASSWGHGLAKDLLMVESCLEKIGGWGCSGEQMHADHSPSSTEELESEIDSLRTMVGSLAAKIRNSYFGNGDGEPTLVRLVKDFRRIKAQCQGDIPIPVDGWGRGDFFDEYSKALKTIGKPLHEKHVLVKIAGNGDFFRRMNALEMFGYVNGQIEKAVDGRRNAGMDSNPETVPLAVLFQDRDAIGMMADRKHEFSLPDGHGDWKPMDISALKRLLMKWRNARLFFLKDFVDEFDFRVFEKEREEAVEMRKMESVHRGHVGGDIRLVSENPGK